MPPHSRARKCSSSPRPPHPLTFPSPAECLEIDGNKKQNNSASLLIPGSLCEAFKSPRYADSRTYCTWKSRWQVTGEGRSEQQESWVVKHRRWTGVAASPTQRAVRPRCSAAPLKERAAGGRQGTRMEGQQRPCPRLSVLHPKPAGA